MGTALRAFCRSPLGAFYRSPLGVRTMPGNKFNLMVCYRRGLDVFNSRLGNGTIEMSFRMAPITTEPHGRYITMWRNAAVDAAAIDDQVGNPHNRSPGSLMPKAGSLCLSLWAERDRQSYDTGDGDKIRVRVNALSGEWSTLSLRDPRTKDITEEDRFVLPLTRLPLEGEVEYLGLEKQRYYLERDAWPYTTPPDWTKFQDPAGQLATNPWYDKEANAAKPVYFDYDLHIELLRYIASEELYERITELDPDGEETGNYVEKSLDLRYHPRMTPWVVGAERFYCKPAIDDYGNTGKSSVAIMRVASSGLTGHPEIRNDYVDYETGNMEDGLHDLDVYGGPIKVYDKDGAEITPCDEHGQPIEVFAKGNDPDATRVWVHDGSGDRIRTYNQDREEIWCYQRSTVQPFDWLGTPTKVYASGNSKALYDIDGNPLTVYNASGVEVAARDGDPIYTRVYGFDELDYWRAFLDPMWFTDDLGEAIHYTFYDWEMNQYWWHFYERYLGLMVLNLDEFFLRATATMQTGEHLHQAQAIHNILVAFMLKGEEQWEPPWYVFDKSPGPNWYAPGNSEHAVITQFKEGVTPGRTFVTEVAAGCVQRMLLDPTEITTASDGYIFTFNPKIDDAYVASLFAVDRPVGSYQHFAGFDDGDHLFNAEPGLFTFGVNELKTFAETPVRNFEIDRSTPLTYWTPKGYVTVNMPWGVNGVLMHYAVDRVGLFRDEDAYRRATVIQTPEGFNEADYDALVQAIYPFITEKYAAAGQAQQDYVNRNITAFCQQMGFPTIDLRYRGVYIPGMVLWEEDFDLLTLTDEDATYFTGVPLQIVGAGLIFLSICMRKPGYTLQANDWEGTVCEGEEFYATTEVMLIPDGYSLSTWAGWVTQGPAWFTDQWSWNDLTPGVNISWHRRFEANDIPIPREPADTLGNEMLWGGAVVTLDDANIDVANERAAQGLPAPVAGDTVSRTLLRGEAAFHLPAAKIPCNYPAFLKDYGYGLMNLWLAGNLWYTAAEPYPEGDPSGPGIIKYKYLDQYDRWGMLLGWQNMGAAIGLNRDVEASSHFVFESVPIINYDTQQGPYTYIGDLPDQPLQEYRPPGYTTIWAQAAVAVKGGLHADALLSRPGESLVGWLSRRLNFVWQESSDGGETWKNIPRKDTSDWDNIPETVWGKAETLFGPPFLAPRTDTTRWHGEDVLQVQSPFNTADWFFTAILALPTGKDVYADKQYRCVFFNRMGCTATTPITWKW
jgi:hypothetical protein